MAPSDSVGASTPAAQSWDGSTLSAWVNNFPGSNGVMKDLVSWRGRIVCIGGQVNRVYYTDVGSDSTLTNFIDIADQSGSNSRGLLVHNNNLYLIKEDSIWQIYDPVSFANRLLCTVGVGRTNLSRCWVSCPVDRRMYWFNGAEGKIMSSNGENDMVVENDLVPLPTSQLDNTVFVPTLAIQNHAQMCYDPVQETILLTQQSVPGVGLDADLLYELCVTIGKSGSHPILKHKVHTYMIFPTTIRLSTAVPGKRQAVVCSSTQNLAKIYELFGQVGSDDGTAITPAYWASGWIPVISEEPWERIRRVNFAYRGSPTIDVYSNMSDLRAVAPGAPTITLTPGDNSASFPASRDLEFRTMKGPNKKGRYHKLQVNGPGVVGKDFAVSALELVIRGGKQER
jgi:hypothetical protein